MQVILIEEVPHLGDMGDVVTVKDGYARNYLIPQKLALRASAGNTARFDHQQKMISSRKDRLRGEALEQLKSLDGISVIIPRKAGDSDKLYGSVTKRDIAAALAEADQQVESKRIQIKGPIRELGIYRVPVKLHADVIANTRVWVVAI